MARNCDLCGHPSVPAVDEYDRSYDKCTNPDCGAYYDDTGVSFKQPEGWKDWMKSGRSRMAKTINTENLWAWIDEQHGIIFQKQEGPLFSESPDTYKMLLIGREEMLMLLTEKLNELEDSK